MLRAVISVLIWLWLLAIPLSYNFWTLDPALYTKFLLLDILLAGALLWLALRGSAMIAADTGRFFVPYAIYIGLSVVSMSIYRVDLPDGIFVWLHLFTLPVLVAILLALDRRSEIKPAQVATAISTMAAVACLIGAVQYYDQIATLGAWQLRAGDAVKATFANKNICAEVLLLTLPFSLYGAARRGAMRIPAAVSLILTIGILCITFSRAVWLAGIVALIVTLAVYLYAAGYWRPRWYHAGALVLSIAVAYIGFRYFVKHTDVGDQIADFYNKRNTIRERRHLWAATWHIFARYIPLGSGIGSWRVENMRYGIVGLRDYATFFQQPHNDYLWVLSEQGIFAFAAVAAAWLYVVRRLLQKILLQPRDLFLYCLAFALTGYAVYAGFAFPRERAEHGIILAFIVFFILRDPAARCVSVPRYLPLLLSGIALAGAWYAGHKMMSEIHLRQFFAARDIHDDRAQRAELDAIDSCYFLLDGTATPVAYYSGLQRFAQNDLWGAEGDFRAAVRANPYHAYSLCNVATCRSMAGDKQAAERYFREALMYAPGFPDAALNLSAIKYNAHQTDSAAWYLGMAEDTLASPRYVHFINVVMGQKLTAMRGSAAGKYDSIVTVRLTDLEKNTEWKRNILRKAYLYHRPLSTQICKDISYVLRHQDHDTTAALKFENENHITSE